MENAKISSLYDLSHTIAADYLRGFEYPWEALKAHRKHRTSAVAAE